MTTQAGIKRRLAALALGVGLIGVLIVVVTLNSEKQAETARARLNQVDLESFRIADLFKYKLREVTDVMRRYGATGDPGEWEKFLRVCEELKAWIDQQTFWLKTEGEQAVLKQMAAAHTQFLRRACELHEIIAFQPEAGLSLAQYNDFFMPPWRRLTDLGQELSRAHYDSRNQVLVNASATLTELRLSVLGLVGLLFVLGAALAVGVYFHLIAPLRVEVVESQALAARNEKLAALGLMAAGVAHEIRNPLTAIKTALFLQQKRLPPNPVNRDDGALVEREILRLEGIVNQFLLFARPAAPTLATVTADKPLEEVHALLAPDLAKAGIQLINEASPPLAIKVDPAQIKQVLINLVQNAADSIGRGGRIALRARKDRKRLANGEGEVVVLEVTDNGKGIPPDVEKRLFDPFFSTKANGTGLGLPIAARIVELHGGALQYQTQVNRGSTFGVVLPLSESAGAPST